MLVSLARSVLPSADQLERHQLALNINSKSTSTLAQFIRYLTK
jgi:hypothetical protein